MGIYYRPVLVNDTDRELMRLIDEIHLECPYAGATGIRNELLNKGHKVGRSHVRTLMRKTAIEALYKKPRLTKTHPEQTIYPYVVRGMTITEANTAWCTDITYVTMAKGFCYLVAVMDWASRKVLSWRLSNTLDIAFCTGALDEALSLYGAPRIFNTDQGSQFTSDVFISILKDRSTRISMDGHGRWMDNVFIERPWKSVKYQDIYLKAYGSITEVRTGLAAWFDRCNRFRHHQGLDDRTPDEVYSARLPKVKDAM